MGEREQQWCCAHVWSDSLWRGTSLRWLKSGSVVALLWFVSLDQDGSVNGAAGVKDWWYESGWRLLCKCYDLFLLLLLVVVGLLLSCCVSSVEQQVIDIQCTREVCSDKGNWILLLWLHLIVRLKDNYQLLPQLHSVSLKRNKKTQFLLLPTLLLLLLLLLV